MVILLSERKSKIAREIREILSFYNANFIDDKTVINNNGSFCVINIFKPCEIKLTKGIAVICDNTKRFENQTLPINIIGICEDNNRNAVRIFHKNHLAVISCGINSKNTVTFSSIDESFFVLSLQRCIYSKDGKKIEPTELKIKLRQKYEPFSILAACAVLLYFGITPTEI
ncbi:MAG: hypothetical protein E7560_02825 [Ruminococcaceae bacterium]|nr:hypothetical protein [Oscillospiraceae bacterium]